MVPPTQSDTRRTPHGLSRRDFLAASAAGCTTALLGTARSGEPRRAHAGSRSRVAWVLDDRAALSWSDDFSLRVDPGVAEEMMDQAIRLFTGQDSVAAAWSQIFRDHNGGADYQSGETIAIKVNYNNNADILQHNPSYQLLSALLRQLIEDVGIPPTALILYDSTRSFHRQFSDGVAARFPTVSINPDSATQFNQAVWSTRLTRLLDDTTYLINMPLLRTHDACGVSLSFKNHLGSVETPSACHDGLNGATPDSSSLVMINRHNLIRAKTLLIVADGLFGLRVGGPHENPGTEAHGILNPFPNSLFVSRDPVAVDSVMIDYLASRGAVFQRFGNPFEPRTYLVAAASIGLGTHETSPDFSYQAIELVRCTNGECSGIVLAPPDDAATPEPTEEPPPGLAPVATTAAGCQVSSNADGDEVVVCVTG